MFQYATGRSLAKRHGVPLCFDLSQLRADPKRDYMLDRFGIQDAGPCGRLRIMWWRRKQSIAKEPHFHYWEQFASLSDNEYLDGYWQSPRYFADIRSELQTTMVPVAKSSPSMRDAQCAIENGASVGVHVRRGDYVGDPITNAFHGVCDSEYYQAAARELQRRVPNARWYVFTDEPEWVRSKLDLGVRFELVSGTVKIDSIQEWWLLSRCRHHVIANSSFSWWAAWLGGQQDNYVVAPQRWFVDEAIDTIDLLPAVWLRI